MGDFQSAFNGLYHVAYRGAFRLTRRRTDAEDIAQEALARAYVRWSRIAEYPEAWVSRVTMNLAIDWIRRQQQPWARLLPPPLVDAPTPDRLDLQRALAALPDRQRQVVAMRYLADLPEETVARALKCSPGTVKQHASRGLAKLRQSTSFTLQEA